MKKKLFFLFCLLTMAMSVSAQQQKKEIVHMESTQARMLDVMSHAIFKPLVVELELVGTKDANGVVVEAKRDSATYYYSNVNMDPAALRSRATYMLSRKNQCDVIVGAIFYIEYDTNNEDQNGKNGGFVTIVGYPANFRYWRSVTESDLKWIQAMPSEFYETPKVGTINPITSK